jgi:hypothetical protein
MKKEKFVYRTKTVLMFETGKEEINVNLQIKLGKTKDELHKIINRL